MKAYLVKFDGLAYVVIAKSIEDAYSITKQHVEVDTFKELHIIEYPLLVQR